MEKERMDIKAYLPLVRKPSRYIGGEVGSVVKDLSGVSLTFGLGFPDVYEVGMSHLGIQILYQILNAREDIACERVFAPWTDMERLLRDRGALLATLENGIPLADLDVMGISLQYELSFTNVLAMLDLGGIRLRAADRKAGDPFVIGGGPSTFNPEPVAPFFDAFLLGDGEEAVVEIAEALLAAKKSGEGRREALERLSAIEGVYVPSFFEPVSGVDGRIEEIRPLVPGYERVTRRMVLDINEVPLPVNPVLPFTETVHDRLSVEIARGCTRGCRFCQAGMVYRPARERSPALVARIIEEGLAATGYDEVSLLSLSTGDYTMIEKLLCGLMGRFSEERVAVSLPSLRVGTLSAGLASEIRKVRKTGFTLAPEAGSARLRCLVNKGITEEDLMEAARDIFSLGWRSVKLYFMIGLPTETDEDVIAITTLAERVRRIGKTVTGRSPQVNVSVSTFIPKPHTPFQWAQQITVDEARARQALLRKRLKGQGIGFKWHDAGMSFLEGVFSRGDRRLALVLERAFALGCRFDGWGDEFKLDLWRRAFALSGVDPEPYAYGAREPGEALPWDHLASGVTKEFLLREYENSIRLAETPDCKTARCSDCGVCDHRVVRNRTVGPGQGPDLAPRTSGGASGAPDRTLRLGFSKTGPMRFLSHLELSRAVTRAVKRAGLRVRYSGGFHPMPRIRFSPPLPVGMESVDEHMEITLVGEGAVPDAGEATARLNAVLPEGIKFTPEGRTPLKVGGPSVMMDKVHYLCFVKDGPPGLDIDSKGFEAVIEDFHKRSSAIARIKKKDKVIEVDLKDAVTGLSRAGDSIRLCLVNAGAVSVRPVDVLAYLFNLTREDASLIPVLKTGPSE
ncbi:MAG: TIGR03960 family B12-binding radical SAM protein [Thermodesulfobacteriota bacterium]